MKSIVLSLILVTSLISCSKNDDNRNNNPFLITPSVSFSLNLNLPQYSVLNFPNESVVIDNYGIKGIVVYCVTENEYRAFELSDPNHIPNSCSKMTITSPIATCPCDDGNKYNIIDGQFTPQDNTKYPMLQFRAERNGNIINVFN